MDLKSRDRGQIGLAEILVESGEPNIPDVLAAYPEGTYTFFARTVGGTRLFGQADLSHFIAEAPIFSPCDQVGLDPNNIVIQWSPVPAAAAYEIELENDDLEVNLTSIVGHETTSLTIPAGFLQGGQDYEIGLTSITDAGNKAVVECEFSTIE